MEILKANDEIALGFNEFTKAITECERLRMQLERLMEAAPSLVIESSDPKYRGGQKFLLADCTELISIMNEQENSDEDHD